MARSAQEERIINRPMMAVVTQMRGVQSLSGFSLKSENPAQGGVWFRVHHGASATSWGEKITVTLTDLGASTKVNIFSESAMPTQLFDGGKNAKVVKMIFDFIESAPVPAQNTAYAPVQTAATAPSANRFCTACGSALTEGSKFCPKCGSKVQ